MALPLKTAGLEESAALRRRVVRQHGMKRISKADHDYLINRLDEIDARIVSMNEENGEEDY